MGCKDPQAPYRKAQIRKRLQGAEILANLGAELLASAGGINPCDGRTGGTLFLSSPNAWCEWTTRTVWDHVTVDGVHRTGPASWSAVRLDSGADIFYNLKSRETNLVDQNTGIRSSVLLTPDDIAVQWWYQPDFLARTPLQTFPIVGAAVPPADMEPIAGATLQDIGYCPRLTRFALVSACARLNILAEYPPSVVPHGCKQLNGPLDGDTSFYLGQWSLLQLQNLGEPAVPFKVVWSEQPGGNA